MENNEEVKVEEQKIESAKPKSKPNMLFTLFACIMTALIVFLAMKLGDNASKVIDPQTNKENTEEKEENTSNAPEEVECEPAVTTRKYRFFSSSISYDDIDQYTTLKLNSDNTYAFYLNMCEGTSKYTGTYTETDNFITLNGETTFKFNKTENGVYLGTDLEIPGCNGFGDSKMTLETIALMDDEEESPKCKTDVTTETYRFFGNEYRKKPDLYTQLKLNSDNTYIFYLNTCDAVKKYTGTYTQTDKTITLDGKNPIVFTKVKGGKVLKHDSFEFCDGYAVGGEFRSETYTIGD